MGMATASPMTSPPRPSGNAGSRRGELGGWILGLALGMGIFLAFLPLPDAWDVPFHLYFSQEFASALAEKGGWPDWDGAIYGGRGSPAFRFYAPGAYLICAGFQYLGFSVPVALKGTVLFFLVVGGFGLRRWMTALGLESALPVGLVLWFASPTVGLHLFRAFLFQNLAAISLLPWILAQMETTFSGGWSGVPLGVLACGAVAWIHLPSALMIGYLGLVIVVGRRVAGTDWSHLTPLAAMAVVGLALASPYFLEAMAGLSSLQFDPHLEIQQPWAHASFLDDPLPLEERAASAPASLVSLPMPNLRLAIRMGLGASVLLLMLSLVTGSCRPDRGFPYLLAGVAGFLVTFRWSLPLWRALPGWASLQYPWRWAWPATVLFLPFMAAWYGQASLSPFLRRVGWALTGLFVAAGLWLQVSGRALPERWLGQALDGDFHYPCEYVPSTCQLADCRLARPLPAKVGAFHQLRLEAPGGRLEIRSGGRDEVEFVVEIPRESGLLHGWTHFDPSWRLQRLEDAAEIRLSPEGPCGQILAMLPTGSGTYRLYRTHTRWRTVGWGIASLAGLVFLWISWAVPRSGTGNPGA